MTGPLRKLQGTIVPVFLGLYADERWVVSLMSYAGERLDAGAGVKASEDDGWALSDIDKSVPTTPTGFKLIMVNVFLHFFSSCLCFLSLVLGPRSRHRSRCELAYIQIHGAGVDHGDVEMRHVRRGPDPGSATAMIIDFDRAGVGERKVRREAARVRWLLWGET